MQVSANRLLGGADIGVNKLEHLKPTPESRKTRPSKKIPTCALFSLIPEMYGSSVVSRHR